MCPKYYWERKCSSCIISSFYIKPQLSRLVIKDDKGCIISSFYIKPQLWINCVCHCCCIISSFYIKPQQVKRLRFDDTRCIISSFYIKPQHVCTIIQTHSVLYYIFILHQTTTAHWAARHHDQLYYIFILHQTTTLVTSW